MNSAEVAPPSSSSPAGRRRFLWHFVEMLVAMVVGMMALQPLWDLVFANLGWSGLFDRPDLGALVMATDMTIGMSLWMRYRKHSWISIGEMGAAMFVPFIVLFIPFWVGLISGEVLMVAGHALMVVCMVVAMLHRRAEYTRDHRHHARAEQVAAPSPRAMTDRGREA